MTIQVGWAGFHNFPRQLTNTDVIAYVLDRLQHTGDEQVLDLASAYDYDTEDIWRCLHSLAKRENTLVEVEQRKWQLVAVQELLNEIEASKGSEDHLIFAVGDLYSFWLRFDDQQLPGRLLGSNAYEESLDAVLERHRQWLSSEYEFLKNAAD